MPSPKDIEEKLLKIINAWRTLAPEKSFGGMTVAQFEAACAPSTASRSLINELQNKLTEAIADRDAADENAMAKVQLVVAGVLADPTEGDDSPLYTAFGYTPRSQRKTGLTRKSKKKPTE